MINKLLYLKGYPEQIKPTIEAFAKYQELPYPRYRELINQELYPKLLELRKVRKGTRKKEATKMSLIHNQAIPACYTLGLLAKEGRPKETRLTSRGWSLLNALENKGEEGYLKTLGKILIDFDKAHNTIIETIEAVRKDPGSSISLASLVIALHKAGIQACERINDASPEEEEALKKYGIDYSKGSRLSDLLKYYQFSNIIVRNGNQIYLNSPRVRDIEKVTLLRSVDSISTTEFFEELYKEYKRKIGTTKGGPYVPIWPDIRDNVCKKLNISESDFVRTLASLPAIIKRKQIHLAHAGTGKPRYQLTEVGEGFYYYIAIFDRMKDNV